MDLKQVLGEGIIGGGAAAVVGLFLLLVRWLVMGFREDLRRWMAKRRQKKLDKQARKTRVEPPIFR